MNLEKLSQLINSKTDRRTQLAQRAQTTESMEEFRGLESEIATLDEEITELRNLYDSLSGATNEDWQQNDAGQRSATDGVVGGFNPIATYSTGAANENRGEEDMFSSLEYRQAFRNYVVNGTPIPEKFKTEKRSDQLTTVGDIGAVIPTTILNQVIEDMTVEGKILSRVTQTSYQGGISIPISEVMPEATWLADENTVSAEQKAKMDAKITFGYHVLEAKVAIGLLTATVSLPVFEATVVKQLKKAMIRL